ncbi:cob(I)yrinic acid a,c-diamide adenosyltransferase [Halopseudomonas xiamenensis]|uniref:cob(I)yrinic acid a,c-diamide adenosyltransferase n=1 Tax=Halopseudomonas xiamenensis TaxID=157792 RepID=UPI0016296B6F|nr:cob(I)yrinic acid a,c-diamide adenosyltransferase [Halopseudomonas xiamenensis]
MGYRLSKLYTRTGDAGTTGLADGSRVGKDSPRIEAMGAVDELNSCIGVLLAGLTSTALQPVHVALAPVQHRLFDIGGELAIPGVNIIEAADVTELETLIDGFNAELPPLKEFILPGGSLQIAQAHLARSVCRRAERRYQTLAGKETINPQALAYLNRLSDLLFVTARSIARLDSTAEVLWQPKPKPAQ